MNIKINPFKYLNGMMRMNIELNAGKCYKMVTYLLVLYIILLFIDRRYINT